MPDLFGKLKERSKLSPIIVPGSQDRRILFVSFFPKLLLGIPGVVKVYSAVDFFEIGTNRFSVLVGNKFGGIAYLMDDAKLLLCLWEYRVYGFSKPFQVVVARNENVANPSLFQVGANPRIK